MRQIRRDGPARRDDTPPAFARSDRQGPPQGLIHGAIVPGNIIGHAEESVGHLLDFGLRPLVIPPGLHGHSAAADLDGFAAIARILARTVRNPQSARPVTSLSFS